MLRKVVAATLGGLCAVVLAASAAAQTVTRGPYLQIGTPTSVVVRWRTDTPTDSRVRYGSSPATLTDIADNATNTTEHEVQLDALAPGTTYYYDIGTSARSLAGGDASHFFVTSPTVGSQGPTRIWVIGDSGTANSNADNVRSAYVITFNAGGYTDVWLMLGDNAYSDGTDSDYQDAVFDMYPMLLRQTVLWPTLGNHDGHTADSDTLTGPYYDIFTLPRSGEAGGVASGTEAYYSFDYANIHFICLDSHDSSLDLGDPMLTWLQNDLAATTQNWIIAYWHHPPYSKGSHDSDSSGRLTTIRENVLPILESYGVDLVLSGHSHSYERSFQLHGHYGTSDTLDAATMILDNGDGRTDGDGAYLKNDTGAVYVVAGSSGKVGSGSFDHPVMFLSLPQLGSLVLDVDGNQLDATFVSDSAVVEDYLTILKGNLAPSVDAGMDASVILPADASLTGTVSDDGLPDPPATVSTLWTVASSPLDSTVTFADDSAVATTASFSTDGTYVLRLTADDSEYQVSDDVTVTVYPVGWTNQAPEVSAGPDSRITLSESATLDGNIDDDGLPDPPGAYTASWSKVSGPGTVTFADANAVDTTASFSIDGTYVLRLTGDDGELSASDDVTIIVDPPPPMIDIRVSADSDDAEEDTSGNMDLGSSDLELIRESTDQFVGMRFNNVTIPPGSTIVVATIQFQVDETTSEATSLTIQAEASDNAQTFVSSDGNISSRERTSESVIWFPPPWDTRGEAGPDQKTPNFATVIQKVVERSGWSSGNSIVVIITGSGKRVAESHNGDSSGAPLLHLEFTTGPPPDQPPFEMNNTGSTASEGGTDPIVDTELKYDDPEQLPPDIAYTITTIPANGQLELVGAPGTAITAFTQADIDGGLVVYVHDGSETTSDSFGFTVDDGQGNSVPGSFNLTVTPQNDDPVLVNNAGLTLEEGATGVIGSSKLSVTDVDNTAAELIYTVGGIPANGQLELTTASGTAVTMFTQADIDGGRLVYVHDGSETTNDNFTFTVSDGADGTIGSTAFAITINAIDNEPPSVVTNTGSSVLEGGSDPIVVTELEYADAEQPATAIGYTVTSTPANGQLELVGAPGTAITAFTQADIDGGLVVYVHDGSETTSDSFGFTVDDGQGNSVPGSFNLTVTPQNDDPVLVNNAGLTLEQGATGVIGSSKLSVTDVDNTAAELTYTVGGIPANGQLELTTASGTAVTMFTQADIDGGRLVYVHDGGETTNDNFTFTVSDGADGTIGSTAFAITINAIDNEPPSVVTNTGSSVLEGGSDPIVVTELEYADAEQPATAIGYTVTSTPANGQLELVGAPGTAITAFTQADIDGGLVVYVHDGSETTSDSFGFTVDDGQGNSVPGSFNLTVTPQNDDPVLVNNAGLTLEEGATGVIGSSKLSVTDVDNTAAELIYTVGGIPANGQLELTTASGTAVTTFTQADIDGGRLVYVHDGGETTADSFSFTVADGVDGSLDMTVFAITVTPQNDPPQLENNAGLTLNVGAASVITNSALAASDVDNSPVELGYTVTASPVNGQLEFTTTPGAGISSFTQADIDAGLLVYAHDGSSTSSDSFTFTVSDDVYVTTPATFDITINAVAGDVVTITEATYRTRQDELKVRATSSAESGVTLTVIDYGEMTLKGQQYELKLKPLAPLAPPSTITVSSSLGGSASAPVNSK